MIEVAQRVSSLAVELLEAVAESEQDRIAQEMQKGMRTIFRKQGELFLEKFETMKPMFARNEAQAVQSESARPEFPVVVMENGLSYLAGWDEELLEEAASDPDIDRIMDEVEAVTNKAAENVIFKGTFDLYGQGYRGQAAKLGVAGSWDLPQQKAFDWAEKNAAELVSKVNKTTKKHIRNLIVYGLEEGESYAEVARSIKNQFEQFAIGMPQHHIRSRAELVAVTEAANAYESGNWDLVSDMENVGIQMEKKWSGPNDGHTSDGCRANMQAGWIPKNQSFPSGDMHAPRFPGCRHNVQYRVSREEPSLPEPARTQPDRQEPKPVGAASIVKPRVSTAPKITPKEWAKSATQAERDLVRDWQGGWYDQIRLSQQGKQLTSKAVTKTEVKQKIKGLNTLLDRAPTYSGKSYRGIRDVSSSALKAMKKSKTISFDAFTSTSRSAAVAEEFASINIGGNGVIFEISGKTGVDITSLSVKTYVKEQEVLFRQWAKFRVVSTSEQFVKKTGETLTKIVLEEI